MNVAAAICTLLCSVTLGAQVLEGLPPGGERRLYPSDAAALNLREPRTSLPCAVKPVRAELAYDLGFETGYQVRIRLRDIAGEGGVLTVIFRVSPDGGIKPPAYFQQKWTLPPIPEDANGETTLDGTFTVGEGDYYVDWLMRDENERVCSAYWRISARLPAGKGPFTTALSRGVVLPTTRDYVGMKQPSSETAEKRLRLRILLHVAPKFADAAVLSPHDRDALSSIVRGIAREPQISSLSITAFNLTRSQIVFREDDVRQIDFAALDDAIGSFSPGTIAVDELATKDAGGRFFVELLADQRARRRADALIFVGPKVQDDRTVPAEPLRELADAGCPVFYLSYKPTWTMRLGADPIAAAVRTSRGSEFSIGRPLDLLSAWSKIMSKITDGNTWRTLSKAQ